MTPISRLWFFIAILIIYCVFLTRVAQAKTFGNFHVLNVNEFSMETGRIVNHNDPYYPYQDPKNATGESWDSETAAKFKLDLFAYKKWSIYWNNSVNGYATDRQYREVQWQYEAGVDFNTYCQVFWRHDSEHLLDARSPYHFPLYNEYLVSVTLFKRERDRK